MVKIRLMRLGRKHLPFYRIVAVDGRKVRDGAYLESIGYYDPKGKKFFLKRDRLEYWVSKGAQPTDTVVKLIAKGGSYEGSN